MSQQEIFEELKKILLPYEKHLIVKTDTEKRYEVEFDKEYTVVSERTGLPTRKRGLYFAGIMVQKGYIGFYFMPVYSDPGFFAGLSQDLIKMLKGKSCFHIRKHDEKIFKEIARMVKKGFLLFQKKEIFT